MRYTYVVDVGDGVRKDFPFSFAGQDTGYLSVSNIAVFIAGVQASNYTIRPSAPNTVTFSTAPAVGAEVLIRRIMPKLVPYTDFSRGNPFSQDSLNDTNLQMLYLIQEIYDGYLPEGFFFRVDIDMRGHKLINLGDGVNDGDSVNMGQFSEEVVRNDAQDGRLTALEDNITAGEQANFFAQLYVATGGETTITTTNSLFCAALYIQGLYQHKIAGAWGQTGGTITFAEPLKAGWQVYLILGTELPSDSIYATIESVAALNATVDSINSQYAKKGANSDITSLSGLTTPLSTGQGGNGNNVGRSASSTKLDVPRGLRVSLTNTNAVNFDGTQDVSNIGVNGVLPLANGGLGSNTAAGARSTIGAAASGDNVDITSIKGNTSGVAAAAGVVGEVLSKTTQVSITGGVETSIVSLTLTPGCWRVKGLAEYTTTVGSISAAQLSVNTVATTGASFPRRNILIAPFGSPINIIAPDYTINVSVATTIYLIGFINYPSGTATSNGYIEALRIR
ncbi:tail fiber protein [Pantoea phage Nufs112]|nr:tail fiber protein [Pantoea phage Nufs112]